MDQTTNTSFVLQPGQGFVFFDKRALDVRTKREAKAGENAPQVALFSGHLMLPGHKRVRIEIRGIDREQQYQASVRQLPLDNSERREDDWKEIAAFEFPYFGNSSLNYVDTELKLGQRSYKLRVIRDLENGRFVLRMPQVMNPAKAAAAMK